MVRRETVQQKKNKYAASIAKVPQSKKSEIFYEYDRAMDRLARLHSFGGSLPSDSDIELDERIERLAKDDLLNFSIHSRRLLQMTKTVIIAKGERLRTVTFTKENGEIKRHINERGVDLWKVINAVIHHHTLEIHTSNMMIDMDVFSEDVVKVATQKYTKFTPMAVLGSDSLKNVCFEIRPFVARACSGIFEPLVEALSENGVYVELDMREI